MAIFQVIPLQMPQMRAQTSALFLVGSCKVQRLWRPSKESHLNQIFWPKTIDRIDLYAIFIPDPKTKVQEHMRKQWKYIT